MKSGEEEEENHHHNLLSVHYKYNVIKGYVCMSIENDVIPVWKISMSENLNERLKNRSTMDGWKREEIEN